MATEAGHHTSRSYIDQAGAFHLNGAPFWNDAEEDISTSLEVLNDLAPSELQFLDGAVAGTLTASKAVVVDASSQIDTFDITGDLTVGGNISGILRFAVQTIDMADAALVLTIVQGSPTGTLLTGNVLYADANSGTNENLLLPPETDCTGLFLIIENTGGETINVQDDAGSAVVTLETANVAYCVCDGTAWTGSVGIP